MRIELVEMVMMVVVVIISGKEREIVVTGSHRNGEEREKCGVGRRGCVVRDDVKKKEDDVSLGVR